MRKKRLLLPACVAGGLLVLCLGAYGLLSWFGSPLLPGSLERRCAREVSAHGEELAAFAQICLEEGQVPDCRPLPGLLKGASVWGKTAGPLWSSPAAAGGWAPPPVITGCTIPPPGPSPSRGQRWSWLPKTAAMPGRARGKNRGFTRPLGGDFYYFEAHF